MRRSENHKTRRWAGVAVPLLAALLCAALCFGLCYAFDNVYTKQGPQPIGGLLFLDENTADEVHYLVRDWEYYPDVLLAPADFESGAAPPPERYVFIGQYAGLDAANPARSPAGAATYRLGLSLPNETRSYALLVPDVYCAYTLYVGGVVVAQMGNPGAGGAGYRDTVGARLVSFEAAGGAEVLLAVASHGWLYGGLTHPPAFGPTGAVGRRFVAAQVVQGAACALALLLGVMFLYIRLSAKYKNGLLYSLLCLAFLCFAGVGLARCLFTLPLQPWAGLYLLGYYALFPLVLLLQAALYGFGKKAKRAIAAAGFGACLLLVGLSVWPAPTVGRLAAVSALSESYKWAMLALMLAGAVYAAAQKRRFAAPVLFAAAFFAFALGLDRLLPMYEPIYAGWFAEVAAFVVLLVLGTVLWRDMVRAMKDAAVLEEETRQMGLRLAMQRQHYARLDEQAAQLRALHHDLRQQKVTLRGHAEQGNLDALLRQLDDFAAPLEAPLQYSDNHTANILLRYYAGLCRQDDIPFEAGFEVPDTLALPDADLATVLGNLLENAVEACRRIPAGQPRSITAKGRLQEGKLLLVVRNTAPAAAAQAAKGTRGFVSAKPGGGQGLRSVENVAAKHQGIAVFKLDDGEFVATVLLKG